MSKGYDARPVVAHVIFRLAVGGLENGVVNLINHMPVDAYRHVVISLTETTDFQRRIVRDDVSVIALGKGDGHAFWIYPRLFKLFRELRPAIVHSRNLAALEVLIPAWAAGVPVRIHGEHGREGKDLDGLSKKYQWLRRFYRPFVTQYIALSRDLKDYLTFRIGIAPSKVTQIYNGVDVQRFRPARVRQPIAGCPFSGADLWLIGTVGRMQVVKDQTTLVRAFIRAAAVSPELRNRLRLVMIGDGPLRTESQALLQQAGLADLAWLPGQRNDVPEVLRGLDCFVLPSLSEGLSNSILEAMASGLPVIATDVGGNCELIEAGHTGELVPAAAAEAMARKIAAYALDPSRARVAGQAGRLATEQRFSLEAMTNGYQGLYDQLLSSRASRQGVAKLIHP
ncbi:MAG: TIGR03088 family PEP-CTERM/XrtA system glycosyltransferase [Candidatus Accumulibacter sp.]|nr:TIGR03088 family PEP-CTERM/XrtA system glycosyltransferase [Accumulibacter sp.]